MQICVQRNSANNKFRQLLIMILRAWGTLGVYRLGLSFVTSQCGFAIPSLAEYRNERLLLFSRSLNFELQNWLNACTTLLICPRQQWKNQLRAGRPEKGVDIRIFNSPPRQDWVQVRFTTFLWNALRDAEGLKFMIVIFSHSKHVYSNG